MTETRYSRGDAEALRREERRVFLALFSSLRLSVSAREIGFLPKVYASHFQLANCSRSAIFLNLPTDVRGMASRKTNASGSCHLAKDAARNARSSSELARAPSFSTTAASGRS